MLILLQSANSIEKNESHQLRKILLTSDALTDNLDSAAPIYSKPQLSLVTNIPTRPRDIHNQCVYICPQNFHFEMKNKGFITPITARFHLRCSDRQFTQHLDVLQDSVTNIPTTAKDMHTVRTPCIHLSTKLTTCWAGTGISALIEHLANKWRGLVHSPSRFNTSNHHIQLLM